MKRPNLCLHLLGELTDRELEGLSAGIVCAALCRQLLARQDDREARRALSRLAAAAARARGVAVPNYH